MNSIPIAVQLWTLRNECQRDFFGTLEAIARVGYKWIEPYDFYGADFTKLAAHLKSLGLGVTSSHVPLDRLEGELPKVLEEHRTIGCRRIICSWLSEERRKIPNIFEKTGVFLNSIAPRLRAEGFELTYHNHDFEFTLVKNPDGIQRILAQCPPENLTAQVDTYWVSYAGIDPVRYIESMAPRVSSIHLKDGDPAGGTFSPIGSGKLDMPAIIRTGIRLGVKSFVVEQDECNPTPIEAIKESLVFLQSQGL